MRFGSPFLLAIAAHLAVGCGADAVTREACYAATSAKYAPLLDDCTLECDSKPLEERTTCEDVCFARVQSSERVELKGCR